MRPLLWALGVVVVLIAVNGVISVLPHFLTRRRKATAPREGLVIFAESIRWLNVRWGTRTIAAGLQRANFGGEFLYWRWHTAWRGTLVLPCIMDRGLLERESQRLADFITDQRRRQPERPIHLMGYSCGAYIAVRALELLAPGTAVDGVALLAAAISPRRDLAAAAARVTGNLAVTSSAGDWLILGLGTLLFGTGDRVHTPSLGMVGPRAPLPPNVVHLAWRPRDLLAGHTGGHFGVSTAGYFARHVAPKVLRAIHPPTRRVEL